MSEKVLHRVEGTPIVEGWSVTEFDGGPVGVVVRALFDNGYQVGSEMLVNELAYLAARVAELEDEKAKLLSVLSHARLAMMEPHGEWKDVREAKALGMIREVAALDAKGDDNG